ncbi:MAG: hypothetical protein V1775_08240 [Bacteroidota bacterium]
MEETFFILLAYQGNEYTVEIEDPTNSIQEIINKLITGLGLSRTDGGGNPATYHLGRVLDDQEEILQTKINGEERTLVDYRIQPGDRLTLTMIPIAG